MEYSEIEIEKAKLKFFSDMIIEELSESLYGDNKELKDILSAIEIGDREEHELLIEYVMNKYNWGYIIKGLDMEHDGDCINRSNPCIRCMSEKYFV